MPSAVKPALCRQAGDGARLDACTLDMEEQTLNQLPEAELNATDLEAATTQQEADNEAIDIAAWWDGKHRKGVVALLPCWQALPAHARPPLCAHVNWT